MRAAPSRSAVEAESPPPGRGGSAHTRWVQTSLNKIMGLRLAVDGQLGPATRSAVRAFQGRKGLAADGIVGPATEAAIVAALGAGAGQAAARGAASGAVSAGACEVLKGFDFDRDQLKPAHRAQVEAAARKVAAAGGASVRVVGHTDPVGSAAYNLALGKRRAERVAAELRAALERIRAGLGRGTTIAVESRGESEAIKGDAPGSRRVEICTVVDTVPCVIGPAVRLDAELSGGARPRAQPPVPPPARPCCMLAPQQRSGSANTNLLNPGRLGGHSDATEANGLIYTGKAGFIDLGHVRELCDNAKFVFDQLTAGVTPRIVTVQGRSPLNGTIVLLGEAEMLKCPRDPLEVARAIAFDAGLGHEIISYDQSFPGGHNSSFSPEDLPSNYLGTVLAERAIKAGGTFNRAVARELDKLVRELDGQSAVESRRAFDLINGRWVRWSDVAGVASILRSGYLRRRNFGRAPFKTGHRSDQPTPPFVVEPFRPLGVYRYTHKEGGANLARSAYEAEIQRIKRDAAAKYGRDFDKP